MNIFGKLFGTRSHREVQYESSAMHFMGPLGGSGAAPLVSELAEILKKEVAVSRAYVSGVKYGEDNTVRVALVLAAASDHVKIATSVGNACAASGLQPIDILFLETLAAQHRASFAEAQPFYVR